MTLRVLSPAKINLFLHVLGRRPDGYHDLLSLMCRIGRYDEVRLSPAPGGVTLECSDPGLPVDDRNLAVRAARRFFEASGCAGGVRLRLRKRIPVAAGLGGGSSNAASVLLGLNRMHGAPLSPEGLHAVGKSLGADVPFFLFQAPALATGIGDRLEAFAGVPPLTALVAAPPFPVSTRMVYQNLNLRLTNRPKQPTKTHFEKTGFIPGLHLFNDLEAVTLGWHPELNAVKERLAGCGALGALMSGSGPSVFGLFPDPESAFRARDAQPWGRGWRVFCAGLLVGPVPMIFEE